jgi:hypothetical protein
MTLHIIVIAYERPIGLRGLIDSFLLQRTTQGEPVTNWLMTIIHDGPASEEVLKTVALYKDDLRIVFFATDTRQGNWGHSNRKTFLSMIGGNPGDYVLITNDDNYYVPMFIDLMLKEALLPQVAIVYCDFLHHNYCYDAISSKLKINHIDMGAFIVEIGLAQEVGFTHDEPAADGYFAEETHETALRKGLKAVHIPKALFVHN